MKLLLLLLFLPASVYSFSQSSHSIPKGIDNTGQKDVTAEVLAFIATIPDNAVINFGKNKVYRMEETLLLQNRQHLVFNGNGSTILSNTQGHRINAIDLRKLAAIYPTIMRRYKKVSKTNKDLILNELAALQVPEAQLARVFKNRTRSHIRLEQCDDITFNNLFIKGPNYNSGSGKSAYVEKLEAQHGFDILKSSNITIPQCTIKNIYGDFFYISGGSRITITNNVGDGNGRQGLAIVAGKNIVFSNNQLKNMRRAVVDLECNGNNAVIDSVSITHNIFGSSRLLQLANAGKSHRISNIYYAYNDVTGGGIWLVNRDTTSNRRNYVFEHNTFRFRGSPQAVFKISGIDNLIIRDNKISTPEARKMSLVNLSRVAGIEAYDNRLTGLANIVHPNSVSKNVKHFDNQFITEADSSEVHVRKPEVK